MGGAFPFLGTIFVDTGSAGERCAEVIAVAVGIVRQIAELLGSAARPPAICIDPLK